MITVLKFLVDHADLIEEIASAIAAGTPKEAIKAAIRRAIIDASDRTVDEEVGIP